MSVGAGGSGSGASDDLTRHDLYEICVQSVDHLAPMIRAMHGGSPRRLGEDFAGTAALSHRWVSEVDGGTAVAVDLDGEALGYHGDAEGVTKVVGDVLDCDAAVDALFVGNFSIGYWHTRAELVAYLKHARARLSGGGVFICDTYGGESAFLTGDVHRDHWIGEGPHKGKRVRYTWEQRDADPVTGMVTDVCHFQVDRAGVVELELPDAFVYEWRLWSVPELRDAMLEAGFRDLEVFDKAPDAVDEDGGVYLEPIRDGGTLDDSFIVCVVGRV